MQARDSNRSLVVELAGCSVSVGSEIEQSRRCLQRSLEFSKCVAVGRGGGRG